MLLVYLYPVIVASGIPCHTMQNILKATMVEATTQMLKLQNLKLTKTSASFCNLSIPSVLGV
jgi:hypothetical protein